jgi:CheY-like chemotaxis protein
MHGGKITVASRIDVGTTVRFTLPITHPADESSLTQAAVVANPFVLISAACEEEAVRWAEALAQVPASTARVRSGSVPAIAAEAELHRPAVVVVRCGEAGDLPGCQELLDEFAENPGLANVGLVLVSHSILRDNLASLVRVLPSGATDVELTGTVRDLLPDTPVDVRRRGRVLIAEDDPDLAAWLRRLLIANGHEVSLAQDGLAAVVRAIEILPDAIILDANMPRMGAADVLPQLRTNPGTREIPVIVISGTMPDAGEYFLSLGADDFIAKPIDADILLACLIELQRKDGNGHDGRR